MKEFLDTLKILFPKHAFYKPTYIHVKGITSRKQRWLNGDVRRQYLTPQAWQGSIRDPGRRGFRW